MFLIITCLVLQFVLNMEQGLPVLSDWLSFTRLNARARKGIEIGPARFNLRYELHVFNPLKEVVTSALFTLYINAKPNLMFFRLQLVHCQSLRGPCGRQFLSL